MNGIGIINMILVMIQDIKNDKCFNKCIDKGFKLDVYISDSMIIR